MKNIENAPEQEHHTLMIHQSPCEKRPATSASLRWLRAAFLTGFDNILMGGFLTHTFLITDGGPHS